MYTKKECVAMLLAGGQGSRLYALTQDMAKPAVPYGGKYRIIDFPLSNCVNSGIDTVGVLTQYQPLVLNDYIGNGQPWDLDKQYGGAHCLPPYQTALGAEWYKGTANAIYQNIAFVDRYNPEYVVVLSGDHIYKMDYNEMLSYHKEKNAAATIAVLDVPMEEASRFGIMNCKPDGTIYEFEEKPKEPKSTLASMGIYIFTWSKLRTYLIADEADPAQVMEQLKAAHELMEYDDEIVTSSVKNFNVDAFIETVAHFLPEGPRWFPEDMGTDASDETLVAEFVREKVLRRTRDEIPHSVGVICDALEQTKKVLRVHATIYVEREGQKGIIIGKGGEMIKHIGIDARRDLERIFGTQVFLELDVKVKAGWRDDEAQIRRFGYNAED